MAMQALRREGPTGSRAAVGVGTPHAVARRAVVSGGLALDESSDDADVLSAGEVLSLRAGVLDHDNAAVVSAMITVHDRGNDVLGQHRPRP